MERYRKLGELLSTDPAGARLAAIAAEIEQELVKHREQALALDLWQSHSREIIAEMNSVVARSRATLASARMSLGDHPFSAEDLREESRLCREEAIASERPEDQKDYATCALRLAFSAEAISRN
jgi:hypothetical protein